MLVWHSFLFSFSPPFFTSCFHAMGNDPEATRNCSGNVNHEALSRTHLVMTLNTAWHDSNVKMLQTAPGWQCTASPYTNKNICRVKLLNVCTIYRIYVLCMCMYTLLHMYVIYVSMAHVCIYYRYTCVLVTCLL